MNAAFPHFTANYFGKALFAVQFSALGPALLLCIPISQGTHQATASHKPCAEVFFTQNFLFPTINEISQLPTTAGNAVK